MRARIVGADGGKGFGQSIGAQAMRFAIERAQATGAASSACRTPITSRASATGPNSARTPGWRRSTSSTCCRPRSWRRGAARDARLSTNPFCVGVPHAPAPLILDFATSMVAMGKARVALDAGKRMAPGLLLDAQGRADRRSGGDVRGPDRRAAAVRPTQGLRACRDVRAPGRRAVRRPRAGPPSAPQPDDQQHAVDRVRARPPLHRDELARQVERLGAGSRLRRRRRRARACNFRASRSAPPRASATRRAFRWRNPRAPTLVATAHKLGVAAAVEPLLADARRPLTRLRVEHRSAMVTTYANPVYDVRRAPEIGGASSRREIVIVGAGPVGLVAAIDLAQRGHAPLVLDEDRTVSVGSRAICYSKRTLEILDRLGCGEPIARAACAGAWARSSSATRSPTSSTSCPRPGTAGRRSSTCSSTCSRNAWWRARRRSASRSAGAAAWSTSTPRGDGVAVTVDTADGSYGSTPRG